MKKIIVRFLIIFSIVSDLGKFLTFLHKNTNIDLDIYI